MRKLLETLGALTEAKAGKFRVGDKVDYGTIPRAGKRQKFPLRGVVELIDKKNPKLYGVRLENGNFVWVEESLLRSRSR